MNKPEHILLQGVVGSQAYGMAVPGHSDVDRGGVYAADPMHLLDLTRDKPEEPSYVQKAPQPDMWMHEAKKILRLALNGNPTSAEILWLNEYEIVSEFGLYLVDIRESFLSSVRIREAYLAFSRAQLHRFFGYDKTTEDGRKHSAKNARHLYRLLYQGLEAYKGNGIIVRLPSNIAEMAREFGERAASGDTKLVEDALTAVEREFDEVVSPLPEVPDNTKAREWLRDLRRSMM